VIKDMKRKGQAQSGRNDPAWVTTWRWPSAPSELHVAIGGSIDGSDVADSCDDVALDADAPALKRVVCHVDPIAVPDIGTVDALARMQLAARRRGWELWVEGATERMRELLALSGLEDVVRCEESDLEAVGKPEGGEEAPRVEEERDATDPTV
jgi:hypothetical protein